MGEYGRGRGSGRSMGRPFGKPPGKPIGSRNCDDPKIDYKEVVYLTKFLSSQASIVSRRRSGFCTQCQRGLKKSIKRARHLGLMPFVG